MSNTNNNTKNTNNVVSFNWKNETTKVKSTTTKVTEHVYLGNKNQTDFPEFIEICKKTQDELKEMLPEKLIAAGYKYVVQDDGFIYAKGNIPFLLTAHMDTVHKETIVDFYEHINSKGDHIISSPQGIGGDDRCGIYMILQLIKEFKPTIIFCEDEEIGGIGSRKFCQTEFINELKDLKFLIELDRKGNNDAVYYSCYNNEFTQFIEDTIGYKKAYGSFSDISTLAPVCGVAAVNLSCGYYSAHTLKEEVNVEEMLRTIEAVKKLLTTETGQFEYKTYTYTGSTGYGSYGYKYGQKYQSGYDYDYDYGYGYGYGYEYDDEYYYSGYYGSKKKNTQEDLAEKQSPIEEVFDYDKLVLIVSFLDEEGKEDVKEYWAYSTNAAWFDFFKDNPNTCWNQVLDYDVDYIV